MFYKSLDRKLKIERHGPHKKNGGEPRGGDLVRFVRVRSPCSTSGIRRITLSINKP